MTAPEHGTNSSYASGCRCDDCTDAHRRAQARYRIKNAVETPTQHSTQSDDTVAGGNMPFPGTWALSGTCRRHPDINFFPGAGEDNRAAKALCAACPVNAACLEYAVPLPALDGIWAGTTQRMRRRIREARKATA